MYDLQSRWSGTRPSRPRSTRSEKKLSDRRPHGHGERRDRARRAPVPDPLAAKEVPSPPRASGGRSTCVSSPMASMCSWKSIPLASGSSSRKPLASPSRQRSRGCSWRTTASAAQQDPDLIRLSRMTPSCLPIRPWFAGRRKPTSRMQTRGLSPKAPRASAAE